MTDSDRTDMIPFMFDEIVVEGDTRANQYAYAHVCPQCANIYNLPTTDTCCDGNNCLVKGCQNKTSLVHYIWDYRNSPLPAKEIIINVTKSGKLRASVTPPVGPAYEVTIGGEQWNKGKGQPYQDKILEQVRGLVSAINKNFESLNQTVSGLFGETK